MGLRCFVRCCGFTALKAIVIILIITFIPNIPPKASFTKSYSVPPSLELKGKLALNERLSEVELWHKGDFVGPEAFAEYNGELYTSLHNGDIVKLTGNHITPVTKFGKPCKGDYQEQICGRPLGIKFDKNGALYAADAYYGIFKVDIKTGKQVHLVSMDQEIDGKKPKLPNSIALASNGDIYWTDSSTEFHLCDGVFDMLSDGSGRLIHYDSKTKQNTVLLKELHFANGIMLSKDESFVIVAETARNRIHRYYLKGSKKGTSDIFIDRLPGLPDNIQSDGQDGFFVPLVIPRDKSHPIISQSFGPFPLFRKFLARIMGLIELVFKTVDQMYPSEWAERGIYTVGHFSSFKLLPYAIRTTILQLSQEGEIIDALHTTNKHISFISEAYIFKDHLYLGTPFNDYIGRIHVTKTGLKNLVNFEKSPSTADVKIAETKQPPTVAPKVNTPPPTVASKPTKPPTEAPKATKPPTEAPKATKPSTEAPKATKSPTGTPKATKPSTEAPKATKPPTEASKATKPSTDAPKGTETTSPPTKTAKLAKQTTVTQKHTETAKPTKPITTETSVPKPATTTESKENTKPATEVPKPLPTENPKVIETQKPPKNAQPAKPSSKELPPEKQANKKFENQEQTKQDLKRKETV